MGKEDQTINKNEAFPSIDLGTIVGFKLIKDPPRPLPPLGTVDLRRRNPAPDPKFEMVVKGSDNKKYTICGVLNSVHVATT